MKERPTLQTDRLILRPFTLADAPDVTRLAGAREVAETTLNIPHPYAEGVAEEWIGSHQENFESGETVNFAMTLRSDGTLIGSIGLVFVPRHDRAEMGYWIGQPYWNRGYATEAARAVIHYAFEARGLNRVYASHFPNNPASGRVMQKAGMTYEGRLRQHVKKDDRYIDLDTYGILKAEIE